MTPRQQAQDGVRMIQQAVLQLIREHGPMQPHKVGDALGLRWQLGEGGAWCGIVYDIMLRMADTGQLTKDLVLRPKYSLGPASTR